MPLRGFAGGTPVKPYSYLCEPRQETSGIRRPAVGRDSRMWCVFKIAKAPKGEYVIVIEGQDDEKEGRALFSIVINGTTVFSGENAFAERGWSRVAYRIPEGVLKKGENRLDFINITPEKDAHLQKTDVDETIGRRVDPFWGWVLFSDIIIVKANQYPTSNQ